MGSPFLKKIKGFVEFTDCRKYAGCIVAHMIVIRIDLERSLDPFLRVAKFA